MVQRDHADFDPTADPGKRVLEPGDRPRVGLRTAVPGVTIERARARLSAAMPQGTRADGSPREAREVRAAVTSRLESTTSRNRTTINVLAAAVGLILLIACVNVGGLLLARGAARQAELAIRASLGAKRRRLMRQLLTECVLLALVAGVVGVVLAWATLDVIVANVPLAMPANSPVTLNLRVLAATVALLIPTTLLFGLVPAIRLSRAPIGSVLARSSRQVGSSLSPRGGQWLIASEVALAVILVAGSGLMLRSFLRMYAVDLGFNPDGLITMEVLPLDRTPAAHKEVLQLAAAADSNAPRHCAGGARGQLSSRKWHVVHERLRWREGNVLDGLRHDARILRDYRREAAGGAIPERC